MNTDVEGYIIKFKTVYLKEMGLKRQDIIKDFFQTFIVWLVNGEHAIYILKNQILHFNFFH